MSLTPRASRILLTLSWAVIFIGVIVDIATEPLLPEPLRQYVAAESNEEWSREDWLFLGVGIPLLGTVVASYIGLYRLKSWGRALWLWAGVAGLLLSPAFGPTVYSAWAEPFRFLSAVLYGVILALAFVPPIGRMIDGGPATQLGNSGVAEKPPSVSGSFAVNTSPHGLR